MKMTDEQRKLVEDNHNLIYGFLNKKELTDDYYDIVALGLCKAAMSYDESKGKFSTLAFKCMDGEMSTHYTYLKRKKFIPENLIFSYNETANEDVSESIVDAILPDNNDRIGYSLENIDFDCFINLLKDKERQIIEHLIKGFNQKEIAEIMNMTQQAVSLNIKSIKRDWKEYSDKGHIVKRKRKRRS